jgi:hypothetical protein
MSPGVQSIAIGQIQDHAKSFLFLHGHSRLLSSKRMSYREELTLSWALTWRLLLSNIIILLIAAMLVLAFGSQASAASSAAFFGLYFAMECLMAWPFVMRRTLPPQVFSLDPRGFALRYWPSVMFGVAADMLSALPLIFLNLLGASERGFVAVALVLVRLFVVLPVLIGFVGRRPATT